MISAVKPISTTCKWCLITIYCYKDKPDSSVRLLQKSQTMKLLFVRLKLKAGPHKLNFDVFPN